MRTISIINQKGGCGKTTTSINLAACLARAGQKTLLLDMDPQGHCGVGLAVPEDQIERTIYDCLIEPSDGKVARVTDVVWQIASDFDLAPANIKLAAFEQIFSGRPGREDRLLKAVDAIRGTYDWVIIDCPPSVGLLTFNALRASDEVIVPVETGFFCLHGLARMMETLELLKDRCNRDIVIRVLPTLYDTRTKLAREVLQELRTKFRAYLMESTINFNTKLKEAASFGQPITEYDPGSRGYKDFANLARELMGHRPIEVEPTADQRLSRPAELVQRARQLQQMANHQFGKPAPAMPSAGAAPAFAPRAQPAQPAPQLPAAEPVSALASFAELVESEQTPAAFGGRLGEVETIEPAPAAEIVDAGPAVEPEPVAMTTQQKIDDFYGVKQEGEDVVFAARFEEARSVMIAGDFNGWDSASTPMVRTSDGRWQTRLPLPKGRYRYRLVVDGRWITDPNNEVMEANQFGEYNNIVEVG